jgi:hypothetical protein
MSDAASAKLARRTTWAAVACLVGLGVVAVAVWALRPRLAPIEVSQQTTYIITPTRTDGWVDYPEAVDWMRRAGLDAGGANAALPLLGALGRSVLPIGADRGVMLERLGIKDAGAEASVLKPLREFAAADGAGAPEPPAATMEWLRARCPAGQEQISFARIRAWLAQFEGPLAELRTASQAASLYVPVPRNTHGNVDRVNPLRVADAAQALGCRAAVALLQGDAPASWADVDAIWRLGQLLARAASPGEYSSALEFWQRATTGTVDLAASPATSPELLSAMQARLAAKLGFPPATETLMFRRLAALDAAGTPRVPVPRAGAQQPGAPMARVGTAANLEAINQQFDALDVAMQAADPKQRIAQVDQAAGVAGQIGVVGRSMLGAEIQGVSCHRLASIAIALARRQRDTGKLPASLAELGNMSKDPGSGADFRYTPGGSQFRLYGVGADGHDDGGDPGKDVVLMVQEPPPLRPR